MRSNATWLICMCRDSPWVHAHTMGESRHEWHMDGTLHSLSQHASTHGNTLQHTVTHGNTRQHIATHCNIPQHKKLVATHCNTLQHTATHCNTLHHTATHCNTLQHTATQHTATHCNTLKHTATHCNTLWWAWLRRKCKTTVDLPTSFFALHCRWAIQKKKWLIWKETYGEHSDVHFDYYVESPVLRKWKKKKIGNLNSDLYSMTVSGGQEIWTYLLLGFQFVFNGLYL